MKIKRSSMVLAFALNCFSLEKALAWGQYGHEQVNEAAMLLLGNSHGLGACLAKNDYLMKRYAITPDMDWKGGGSPSASSDDHAKRMQNDLDEHALHFFERDAFFNNGEEAKSASKGEYADVYPTLHTQLSLHVSSLPNPSVNDVTSHGTAPWRVLQLYRLSIQALKHGDIKLALLYLGTLGHYVGDLGMPFHGTLNYDGQKHNPPLRGIHEVVDTLDLPTRGKDSNDVYPNFDLTQASVMASAHFSWDPHQSSTLVVEEIIPELFQLIDTSYPLIQKMSAVFSKYHKHLQASSPSEFSNRHGHHPKPLDPVSLQQFTSEVIGSVEERLGTSASLVARLWVSAYVAAGKPALDDSCGIFDFDQSFAIQNYPRPSKGGPEGYLVEGYISKK